MVWACFVPPQMKLCMSSWLVLWLLSLSSWASLTATAALTVLREETVSSLECGWLNHIAVRFWFSGGTSSSFFVCHVYIHCTFIFQCTEDWLQWMSGFYSGSFTILTLREQPWFQGLRENLTVSHLSWISYVALGSFIQADRKHTFLLVYDSWREHYPTMWGNSIKATHACVYVCLHVYCFKVTL